jgi:hypothetical protein
MVGWMYGCAYNIPLDFSAEHKTRGRDHRSGQPSIGSVSCASTDQNQNRSVGKHPVRSMARPRIRATDCKIPDSGARRGPDRAPRESLDGFLFHQSRVPRNVILE